jgi:hypothetical protein
VKNLFTATLFSRIFSPAGCYPAGSTRQVKNIP